MGFLVFNLKVFLDLFCVYDCVVRFMDFLFVLLFLNNVVRMKFCEFLVLYGDFNYLMYMYM